MPRALPLITVATVVALAPTVLAQEAVPVGRLGDRIVVNGCEQTDPASIALALRMHPDWSYRSAPSAARRVFLEFVSESVREGFLDHGWSSPEVKVTAGEDDKSIVIDVVEGPHVTLERITVDGAKKVAADDLRAAVGKGRVPWRVGKPGRFGKRGMDSAWKAVLDTYRDAGEGTPTGRVEVRDGASADRAVLAVVIESESETPKRSIEFGGTFTDDAAAITEKIGWNERGWMSPREVRERTLAIGRYARVDAVVGTPGSMLVRLAQLEGAPPWDETPWEELSKFRAAKSGFVLGLVEGQRGLQLKVRTDEWFDALRGEIVVVASRGRVLLEALGVHIGDRALPDLAIAVDDVSVRVAADDAHAAMPHAHGKGVQVRFGLAPQASGQMDLDWGVGISSGSHVVSPELHEAVYLALCGRDDVTVERGTERTVFRQEGGPVELVWSHAADDLQFVLEVDEPSSPRFEVVSAAAIDERIASRMSGAPVPFERIVATLASRLGSLEPSDVELMRGAARVATQRLFERAASASKRYAILSDPRPQNHPIFALMDAELRALEREFLPGTWPWLISRFVSHSLGPKSRLLQQLKVEDSRLIDQRSVGPIGALFYAVAYRTFAPETFAGQRVAGFGLRQLDVEAAFRDLRTLGRNGNAFGRYLDALAREWTPEQVGLEAGAEPDAVLRAGFERVWNACLRDMTRAALEALSER